MRAPRAFALAWLLSTAALPALAALELGSAVQVSTGEYHTCALLAGGVKCWGYNNHSGALGDGTTENRRVAVGVVGLSAGIAAVTAGTSNTCALTSAGGVKCWGSSGIGISLPNNAYQATPIDVPGLTSGVVAIDTYGSQTCTLMTSGGVKCWSGAYPDTPTDIAGIPAGTTAISVGAGSCLVTSAGGVKCWGGNYAGQLGDNSQTDRATPVDVVGLGSGIAAVRAGYGHTCAITTAGGVKCWGGNSYGQLGDGTVTQRLVPTDVSGLSSGAVELALGEGHSCARMASGGVKCWGWGAHGELGNNSSASTATPVDVIGLGAAAVSISASRNHSCAVLSTGAIKCWGNNQFGQLGDDSATPPLTPAPVVGFSSGTADVAPGKNHSCALGTAGGVKCWGANFYGELGDNSTIVHFASAPVPALSSGVVAIGVGAEHSCAVTSAGTVKCWGSNFDDQLGYNPAMTSSLVPIDIAGVSDAAKLSIGHMGRHSCVVTTGGGAKCWGSNAGKLGDNTVLRRSGAVDVVGLANGVASISAGGISTCAVTTSGGLFCWGAGLLGNGSANDSSLVPVQVAGFATGVAAVSVGYGHACLVTTGGGLKCWGANYEGQLGDGTIVGRDSPVDVVGLSSGVVAVAAGYEHTCALTAAGGVKCWGAGGLGALGNGNNDDSLTPVDVIGLASGVLAIRAGANHTCAITTARELKCWGDNTYGQVGDGNRNNGRTYPVAVQAAPAAPGAPTITNATPGSASATIFFDPPSNDGGSAVTSYAATCNPGAFTQAGPSSPITVAGLANGTPYACSVTAANAVGSGPASAPANVTPVAAAGPKSVAQPAALDFGGQSMGTTSPALVVGVVNAGTGTLTVGSIASSNPQFVLSDDCAALAAGAACHVEVRFVPAVSGGALNSALPASGTLTITTNGTGSPHAIALAGNAEKSLVSHYYRSILRRAPDGGGKAFWESEAARLAGIGANLNEAWFAMAMSFYNSAEYASFGRSNDAFVTDLYNSFFNRAPDGGGLAFWSAQIASGLPREIALVSFMFSAEFVNFTQAIFGNTAARPEVDVVVDFYRGILGRLPDPGGFDFWVQQFRNAQCTQPPSQRSAAILAQVSAISGAYVDGAEYAGRGRDNSQVTGDYYNAFLRRGGDQGGVQFWIAQLDGNARSRSTLRQDFLGSAEFSTRVQAMIAAGCLP